MNYKQSKWLPLLATVLSLFALLTVDAKEEADKDTQKVFDLINTKADYVLVSKVDLQPTLEIIDKHVGSLGGDTLTDNAATLGITSLNNVGISFNQVDDELFRCKSVVLTTGDRGVFDVFNPGVQRFQFNAASKAKQDAWGANTVFFNYNKLTDCIGRLTGGELFLKELQADAGLTSISWDRLGRALHGKIDAAYKVDEDQKIVFWLHVENAADFIDDMQESEDVPLQTNKGRERITLPFPDLFDGKLYMERRNDDTLYVFTDTAWRGNHEGKDSALVNDELFARLADAFDGGEAYASYWSYSNGKVNDLLSGASNMGMTDAEEALLKDLSHNVAAVGATTYRTGSIVSESYTNMGMGYIFNNALKRIIADFAD